MKNLIALNETIHPELEPGVINHIMIHDSYRQGYKGESARLKDLEEIDYDKITTMRLEFKNILRVDHLWVLPNLTKLSLNFNKLEHIENIDMLINLKELDLSFNYIEKIDNLFTLVNLETLSLFNNLIKKIENLQNQENLVILSLGNNKITSLKGIEHFRFFDKLKVLNLEGNPVTDNDPYCRIYISAVLPKLRYYKYVYISDEEREEGNNKYVRELRDISNSEEEEVNYRATQEYERLEKIRLQDSFIEDFRENKYYQAHWDTFFLDKISLLVVDTADEVLLGTYRNNILEIAKQMYNYGFEKYEERKLELSLFDECCQRGLDISHKCSRKRVENFLEIKEEIEKTVRKQFIKIETYRMQGIEGSAIELTEPNEEIERLSEDYHGRIDELWEILMKQEVNLFESMEETIILLKQNLTNMIDDFIAAFKIYYKELRQLVINFCEELLKIVSNMENFNEVPEDVQVWINGRGGVKNAIYLYKNKQLQKLLLHEERIVLSATKWLSELIENKNKDELIRNRSKIVEINYFLDQMRELFVQTSTEVQEEMIQEQPEP